MPPFPNTFIPRADFQPSDASDEFRKQWTHPGGVFAVLLILGGVVVERALAQSTGWPVGLPSFSFGWVAYAVNALVAAVGENKLMPQPDYSCLVVNGKSGYARDNKSWIIGRIVRDYKEWMDKAIQIKVDQILEEKQIELKSEKPPPQAGLCVSIYKPNTKGGFGAPMGWVLVYQSIAIAILQLGVAAIPCGIYGDWGILMITACGIFLSIVTASLTQWRKEKWDACRRQQKGSEKNIILTRGNGSQHAIAILGTDGFLDLEDLASGQTDATASGLTRLGLAGLAVLWILLLISASGLENNTSFLLAVGGIGILFNIWVAGHWKEPKSVGLPITYDTVIAKTKVMKTLYAVEEKHRYLGKAMLDIFFPGKLRNDEAITWSHLAGDYENAKLAATYRDQGKWDDAEKLEEQLMKTLEKELGADSDFTLKSMENMALIYRNQGKQNAEKELEDRVKKVRKVKKQADKLKPMPA